MGREGRVKSKRKNTTCRFNVSNNLKLGPLLHGYNNAAALKSKPRSQSFHRNDVNTSMETKEIDGKHDDNCIQVHE